jgi:hypothetical protein
MLQPDYFPIFTSDGLKHYFYALTAQFNHWQLPEGTRKPVWEIPLCIPARPAEEDPPSAGCLVLSSSDLGLGSIHTKAGSVPDDPKDEMFLACALDGQADFTMSSNHHLLA